MSRLTNLLIVAGTGRNSGKTTIACNIIGRFSYLNIIAIKISPHFHEACEGLELIKNKRDYKIYRDTNAGNSKDSSRMLAAGASTAYFIQVYDHHLCKAFEALLDHTGPQHIFVAESPALRKCTEPGVLIIADNPGSANKKDLGEIMDKADIIIETEFCRNDISELSFNKKDGWKLLKKKSD